MTATTSREPARTPVQSAGSRTTLTVISLSAAAGAIAGWGAFYGIDRFRFLWGHTVREHRWAGWAEKRRAAA